jgi:UPF0716 protein FxsA
MRFLTIFAVIALAEMATFFWVESRIGLGWALGLALATALIGSYLTRRAGLSVLGRIQRKFREGQIPGRELVDGAGILVAGAFLISPGFITDAMGFLLLLGPVRDLVYRGVSARLSGRVTVFSSNVQTGGRAPLPEEIVDIDPE